MQKLNEKLWNWASILDDVTREQAERTSRLAKPDGTSVIAGHVALMADAHLGIGATVGSVVPTENAILPSAVGVDTGCGMASCQTKLTSHDLPDSLDGYLGQAVRDVPAGMGQGHDTATDRWVKWIRNNPPPTDFSEKQWNRASTQFGSLGSGNHFYEVCLDEADNVWLVLHSGSRGIGNELATIHIKKARQLMQEAGAVLEDPDLAYLVQGQPEFDAYIADMLWSQSYAMANRTAMIEAALRGFLGHLGLGWTDYRHETVQTVACHHNYAVQEMHGGKNLWITRKGAISARSGELGVIPGSMGAASYIVRGLGNPDSYESSSHGAGRLMSRTRARKEIDRDAFRKAMVGKSWQSADAESLVDEAPMAYKPVEQIMADQADLVEVVHSLRSIFNYKGVERSRRR